MITVLSFDIGTTGVKTCLFEITDTIRRVDSAVSSYGLRLLPGGGAEQDPHDWWQAMVTSCREVLARQPGAAERIDGITFCAQMQCLVLVDADGEPVHPALTYMDQRAGREQRELGGRAPRIAGVNAVTALRSLRRTGAVAASVKDPVWKYHWVRRHRPEAFARVHAWLDAKEAMIARMTGRCVMSRDSAFATLLYDVRADTPRFDPVVTRLLGVDPHHLPPIVESTDRVGSLRPAQAAELGLPAGIAVYAGGGDASLIGLGAGATRPERSHVYMGTSGWFSTVTERRVVDIQAMIASIVGVDPTAYQYFAELETAGKCLEWVRDHLALDEIHVYLRREHVADDPAGQFASLYDYLSEVIARAEPGAGGVLFAPWLHGNRCPFEDANARGMFVNISLNTGKTELLRAVVEGVCLQMRWFAQVQAKRVPSSGPVRFVGGGALSRTTAQILADVLQRPVEVPEHPQDAGATGAALLVAVAQGQLESVRAAERCVAVRERFEPDPGHAAVYDRHFRAFTQLYRANRGIFRLLNGDAHGSPDTPAAAEGSETGLSRAVSAADGTREQPPGEAHPHRRGRGSEEESEW